MPSPTPPPAEDAPGVKFKSLLASGSLHIQHCKSCDSGVFYPRTICPHCGSDELEWKEASQKGTVYSSTTVRRRPDRGGDYNVAIVELEEGPRMMSRVDGVPPEEVRIGMNVRAKVVTEGEETLIVFEPSEGGAA